MCPLAFGHVTFDLLFFCNRDYPRPFNSSTTNHIVYHNKASNHNDHQKSYDNNKVDDTCDIIDDINVNNNVCKAHNKKDKYICSCSNCSFFN